MRARSGEAKFLLKSEQDDDGDPGERDDDDESRGTTGFGDWERGLPGPVPSGTDRAEDCNRRRGHCGDDEAEKVMQSL